jgi:hypothetical protein
LGIALQLRALLGTRLHAFSLGFAQPPPSPLDLVVDALRLDPQKTPQGAALLRELAAIVRITASVVTGLREKTPDAFVALVRDQGDWLLDEPSVRHELRVLRAARWTDVDAKRTLDAFWKAFTWKPRGRVSPITSTTADYIFAAYQEAKAVGQILKGARKDAPPGMRLRDIHRRLAYTLYLPIEDVIALELELLHQTPSEWALGQTATHTGVSEEAVRQIVLQQARAK